MNENVLAVTSTHFDSKSKEDKKDKKKTEMTTWTGRMLDARLIMYRLMWAERTISKRCDSDCRLLSPWYVVLYMTANERAT